MQIMVKNQGKEIVFALNNSGAANSLYAKLPLKITIDNYSNNEKIFSLRGLDTSDTPLANPKIGSIAYFAPWHNVVMYYGDAEPYGGLYDLGKAISGSEYIKYLSGIVEILPKE